MGLRCGLSFVAAITAFLLSAAAASAQSTRPAARFSIWGQPAATRPASAGRPASGERPAATRPTAASRPAIARPARRAIEVRKVTFVTEDNIVIGAGYAPPKRGQQRAPVVILLHMYRQDRTSFDPLLPYLHDAGFAVLAVDLRGHGESANDPALGLVRRAEERDPELFRLMRRDVEAAYAWLSRQSGIDPSRFVMAGASVGCSVALDYAARDRSVDGVVCLTPGTSYLGLNSVEAVQNYGDRPLFLLASNAEKAGAEDLARVSPSAEVIVVPGDVGDDPQSLHGTRMFGQVPQVEERITTMLQQAAGEPSEEMVVASIMGKVWYPPTSSSARSLSEKNVRWFSSVEEAESRGYGPKGSTSRRRTEEK